jgi:hypothetical protein
MSLTPSTTVDNICLAAGYTSSSSQQQQQLSTTSADPTSTAQSVCFPVTQGNVCITLTPNATNSDSSGGLQTQGFFGDLASKILPDVGKALGTTIGKAAGNQSLGTKIGSTVGNLAGTVASALPI